MREIFFPDLLPGETVYSLCSRIEAINSFSDAREASVFLVGHERGGFHHEMPFGLNRLIQASDGTLPSLELLIRGNTALATVLPFLAAQKRRQMLDAISSSKVPTTSWAKVGASNAGNDAQHFLRRCPDCVREDHILHELTYWHVQHQFLGVWTCPIHGRPLEWLPDSFRKKFNWRQAERDPSDFNAVSLDAHTLLLLDCLAQVILWTASMPTFSTSVLNIMTRSRLRRAGMLHTEIKITETEMTGIHNQFAGRLFQTGISHFVRFSAPAWIKETLIDPRASHPLRWALLIASTLGDDFFQGLAGNVRNRVKSSEQVASLLQAEYQAATERAPQMTLFKTFYRPRITRAPEQLYRALGNALQVSDAAQATGLSVNEVRIWIKRDTKLATHWRHAIAKARTLQARTQIVAYLRAHPNAQRIDVLRANLSAIRLLERYNQDLLRSLLPSAWTKFNWQPLLPLEFAPP